LRSPRFPVNALNNLGSYQSDLYNQLARADAARYAAKAGGRNRVHCDAA